MLKAYVLVLTYNYHFITSQHYSAACVDHVNLLTELTEQQPIVVRQNDDPVFQTCHLQRGDKECIQFWCGSFLESLHFENYDRKEDWWMLTKMVLKQCLLACQVSHFHVCCFHNIAPSTLVPSVGEYIKLYILI